MLKINKKTLFTVLGSFLLFFAILLIFIPQEPTPEQQYFKRMYSYPARQLKSYNFNAETDVISRVAPVPDSILKMLRKLDNCPAYVSYTPSKDEMKIIEESLCLLPPVYKDILKMRLVNIYFVKNFYGGGITDWILDENGKIYFYIIFNPETLKMSAGDWFTYRDNSCFVKDTKNIKIKINCGKKYKAFIGVLLHEASHVVDCVLKITPYLDDDTYMLYKYEKVKVAITPFVKDDWQTIYLPSRGNDFPLRGMITFYRLNNGPKINISDAKTVYNGLSKTRFVSLYSSKSWAEDSAEFMAFSYFVRKLNQPYVITLFDEGKKIYSYEPLKNNRVAGRCPPINALMER